MKLEDEGDEMKNYIQKMNEKIKNLSEDELRDLGYQDNLPFKGIINGLLFSIPIWILIGLIIWLFLR